MKQLPLLLLAVLALVLSGCQSDTQGSQEAAEAFFDSEFTKWMAGQDSEVNTFDFRIRGLLPPISYHIRSITEDEPFFLEALDDADRSQDWKSWPAYRFNVVIEWKSQAETPMETVTRYTLTWNPVKQKWYVEERLAP